MKGSGVSFAEIGRTLGFAESTVQYHVKEDYRKKAISRSLKNPNKWSGKKEYMKKYMSNRYNNDEEFREKVKESNKLNQRKRYGKK